MPAFGDALLKDCVWEWKPYYLNYERLKVLAEQEIKGNDSQQGYEAFKKDVQISLHRVENFYQSQEKLIHKGIKNLGSPDDIEEQNKAARLLMTCKKLQSFAESNVTGFRKITKKLDKNVKSLKDKGALDFEAPPLREETEQKVHKHCFAAAATRLKLFTDDIEAWEQNKQINHDLRRPSWGMSRTTSFMKNGNTNELNDPLLVISEDQTTASRLMIKVKAKGMKKMKSSAVLAVMTAAVAALAFFNVLPLKPSGYVVIWATAVVLLMLLQQKAPDVVLMGATLFLTVSGIITSKDAWAAFSNDVVLSVAGLGVVANAVESTGIIDVVFGFFLGKPKSLTVAMIRLFLPATVLNVCISNTCVMSCLLPVIDRWATEIGFHKAYFLMPLSYILLISGTFAIFSTSTNLIAQGLLVTHHKPPFGMFDLAIPASLCTLVAILYLLVATPFLLRRFKVKDDVQQLPSTKRLRRQTQAMYDIRVQITGNSLDQRRLEETDVWKALNDKCDDIISLEHYGQHTRPVKPSTVLSRDDVIWMRTSMEVIPALFFTAGVSFLALDILEDTSTLDMSTRDLVEAVLTNESPLIGHKLGDARKHKPEADCLIVAFKGFGNNQDVIDDAASEGASDGGSLETCESGATADTVLGPGDHIILNAPSTFYSANKDSSEYVVLRKVCSGSDDKDSQKSSSDKAVVSGCILLLLIGLVSTSTLALLEGVFVALALLIATKCTTMDQCVKAVKLRTVMTIVGAFGLGKAIGQEGVARLLAEGLIAVLHPFGPRGLLVAIFASTVALGTIFHGTAVVVLMFPICLEVANTMQMPIHQVVAVLCLSVACQMLSPISYQTNLMAYSTGAYQFADFTKVGSGAVVAIMLVTIPICEYSFPA